MGGKGKERSSRGGTAGDDFYELRFRKDGDGFELISDRLRYAPIWYAGPDAGRKAVAYAKYRSLSRSQRAIIRVFDASGAIIQRYESSDDFRQ